MPITEIVFYGFSLVLVAAAVAVITARNPIYSALFLVLAFFSSSAIWMLLEVEFLAIVLILVYVGAVMVLSSNKPPPLNRSSITAPCLSCCAK